MFGVQSIPYNKKLEKGEGIKIKKIAGVNSEDATGEKNGGGV